MTHGDRSKGTSQSQGGGEERRRRGGTDVRTTPSQAEGERATVEEGICRQEMRAAGRSQEEADACDRGQSETEAPQNTAELPSQAEGERDTVEEDLDRPER